MKKEFIITEAIFHIIKANNGLMIWYERKVESRGVGKAKIGLVRKLTVIIWHLLTYEEDFRGYARKMVIEKMRRYKRVLERYIREEDMELQMEIAEWIKDWESLIEEEIAKMRLQRLIEAA